MGLSCPSRRPPISRSRSASSRESRAADSFSEPRLTGRAPTFGRDALRVAVHTTFVSLSSYVCGFQFTHLFDEPSAGIGGLWSVIAGIMVLQATRQATRSSAWLRVLGTLIGAIIGAVYLSLLSFSAIGMAASILATVLLCHAARIPQHARLAALTVAVILVLSSLHSTLPPIVSATLRFCESSIGATMAVVALLVWPEPTPTPGVTPAGER